MGLIATVVLAGSAQPAEAVQVWLTGGNKTKLLSQESNVAFTPGSGSHPTKINVDQAVTYQTMSGFGAAMTDSSAWLIQNELNAAQRDDLMTELFSPTAGIGISYLRVPMGASDFALNPYTYNDQPGNQTDPDQSEFSIAHDQAYIVPSLQEAKALNPQLQMMATPWSAPAWMKTNTSLIGGSLQSQYYGSYADYFVKFFQGYQAQGLTFDTLTVQNEPLNPFNHPSMEMSTFQQSTFIGDHLGPALATAGIGTKIVSFDHNWEDWNYPVVIQNDPEAGQYVTGTAFHAYAGSVDQQSNYHDFFPDKDVYFTEISGGDWAPNFSDNLMWYMDNIIIGSTRNWAKTALFWNLALDQNDGPFLPGGCSECRGVVTIDTSDGSVDFNEEFYSIAHASKFVQPGALRIDTDSLDGVIETVGFLNPDGSRVLIAMNPASFSRSFDVVEGGEAFTYNLSAKSVATFVWDDTPALQGDLDGDGFIGISDLNLVLGEWNRAVPPGNPLADPTGDGFVGIEDLNLVLGNWNDGTPPGGGATIPEPAGVAIAALFLPVLARRPRSHN
jgi:glucosylceramidase